MKTIKQFRFYTLILFLAIIFSCTKNDTSTYRFKLHFITENYKPFNFTENSALKGLAPDLLKEVCSRLNVPLDVKVLPWSDGYNSALTTDNAVLFSTVLNSERKNLFKWAGPIASIDWKFYASSKNIIGLNSQDDAKKQSKIGVIKDYSIEQYLAGQGFNNLVYCSDNIDAFTKLLNGEIDLFPSDAITAEAALATLNKSIYMVEPELTISTDLIYFAFNQNIPDDVVSDFQKEIDLLKSSGFLMTLTNRYLNTSDAPGPIEIYTEDYPPLTFRDTTG